MTAEISELNISISSYKKFKVVFLGDQSVGKSCIISRYSFDSFDGNSNATIGVDFMVKSVFHHGQTYKVHFWDTAGQERFHSLIPSYIKDCEIAVLVYDVNKRGSFDSIDKWIAKIREERGDSINLAVVGNKIDLDAREVATEEGLAKALSLGAIFCEVSAKQGTNVTKFFETVLDKLLATAEFTANSAFNPELENTFPVTKSSIHQQRPRRWCCRG